MTNQTDPHKSSTLKFIETKLAQTSISQEMQKKALIAIDIVINLVIVVVLVVIIRTFIMSPFQVYGISMCNTLNFFDGKCQDTYGDYIIINKSSYLDLLGWKFGTPQRGDIIVFHPPQNHQEFYIKRVIGLPGETIKLIDGYVYIYNSQYPQGIKIDEPYLSSENSGGTFATGGIDEFTVPQNQYFVLGDNRKHSTDSRLCFRESPGSPGCGEQGITPYLTLNNIEGKAAVTLWPNPHILVTHIYKAFNSK